MKQLPKLLVAILLVSTLHTYASDTLVVAMNKAAYKKGDTINIDGVLKYTNRSDAAVTLNVWIEDVYKTRKWMYRYPILNGIVTADIIIGNEIPDGNYAVNFLVQQEFFVLKGKIRDHSKNLTTLNYLMLAKNKNTFFSLINVEEDGSFRTNRFAFEDTARFVFSAVGKKNKRNDLYIDVVTPLDSNFVPIAQTTQFIKVGNPLSGDTAAAKKYQFNDKNFTGKFTLDEVVVKTTKKKKVELFDEQYSSGLFKGGDFKLFDGLENTEIESSIDIFSFLQGRVAGLQIMRNDVGGYNITWRGGKVDVYLDEFKLDADDPSYVNPADVAMIKVFSPLSGPSGNGAIAIYTKRGVYSNDTQRRYNFLVKGFTPSEVVWK